MNSSFGESKEQATKSNARIASAVSEGQAVLQDALSAHLRAVPNRFQADADHDDGASTAKVSPPPSSASAASIDSATLLKLAESVLAALPAPIEELELQRNHPCVYERPLAAVLHAECNRYNGLLRCVRASLRDMSDALLGIGSLSTRTESEAADLVVGRVPAAWAEAAYPSRRPLGSWVEDLSRRVAFFRDWAQKQTRARGEEAGEAEEKGEEEERKIDPVDGSIDGVGGGEKEDVATLGTVNSMPNTLWLGGFAFPQALLTALRQAFARNRAVAMDEVELSFAVLPIEQPANINAPPEEGAYVHGLWLEGATWDSPARALAEAPHGVLIAPLPVLWILPRKLTTEPASFAAAALEARSGDSRTEDASASRARRSVAIDFRAHLTGPGDHTYQCPVYRTADRAGALSTSGLSSNFILAVELPMAPEHNAAHWTRRSVALVCENLAQAEQ
jgi:dynein heavy chain